MSRTVAFYTLGCKLNFAETSSIARLFTEGGYQKVDFEEGADIFVVNTCSVTENADKKCRRVIRKALGKSPHAHVIVVGCYAQLKPEEIRRIPGVNLVLGAADKFNIMSYLEQLGEKTNGISIQSDISEVDFFVSSHSMGERTRSFLKVQDGCDYTCAFCTIPLARGKSRSDTVANVLKNAEQLATQGIKEIVLTGVNIGDFGKSSTGADKERFLDLIQQLDMVEGIKRFRISSIEPNLLDDDIISFVAGSQRFMPHFHIPLQSGSDKILGAMRRRYKSALYTQRVTKIKELMPHACIGVDVIVGFPGETEENFMETFKYLKDLDVSYLHVFTYSERDSTDAIKMADPVSWKDRNRRSEMLRSLSQKKRHFFYTQHLSSFRPVLMEDTIQDGFMNGFTDNYIKVRVRFDPALINQIIELPLDRIGKDGLVESPSTRVEIE